MSHRKPTGTTGPVRLTAGGAPEFKQTAFPSGKDAIEQVIVRGALQSAQEVAPELRALYGEPVQDEENNYDFSLLVGQHKEFLELAEIVFPGGHEATNGVYIVGDYADLALKLIKRKAKKYGLDRRDLVHLLIYTTDWRMFISDSVLTLLRTYTTRKRHSFKTIAYYAARDLESGVFEPIYPSAAGAAHLGWFEEHRLRGNKVTNYDPEKIRVAEDGHSFYFDPPTQDRGV